MKVKGHQRYRTKDGEIVPGVSGIVGLLAKDALIKWSNELGLKGIDSAKYTDDKAAIGTLAHSFIADGLQDLETDTSDYDANQIESAQNCVRSFDQWARGKEIRPVLIEKPLVSERFCFGGTSDLYARIDGVKELIDLKSGTAIWPEFVIQVSAYRQLLRENGHEVTKVRLLNIPRSKTESFQELIPSDTVLDLNWELFLHLLEIYNIRKQLK